MELHQIRYFLAVAEERNFGRAAERLRIAQSAVSQQIKALERSLGTTLFDRTTRPIELTHAGEVFFTHARLILESADRAVEETAGAAGHHRAIIRFGMSTFGGGPIVDELILAAQSRLTDVDLQVTLNTTLRNIEALDRRTLDVAFAFLPFESEEQPRYLPLGAIEYMVAVPSDHRLATSGAVSREDLREEPTLFLPRSINPLLADHVSRLLFGRSDHPWIDVWDVGPRRLELVAQGAGLTPIAFPIERMVPMPGVVYLPVEGTPTLEYGLLWFDDHASPSLLAFIDLAREIRDRGAESREGRLASAGA